MWLKFLIPPASLETLALALLCSACGPSIEPGLSLELNGETVDYVAESADGEPLGSTFVEEAGQVFSSTQRWTTNQVDGARSEISLGFGSYTEVVVPVSAVSNSGLWFSDADGVQFATGEWRVDQVIPTGKPEQPVLYAGAIGANANGTLSMGPWCGEGEEHSTTGCGFPVPEGTTEAEIAWEGMELVAQTDGCSSAAWSEQLAPGNWTWSGDTLTLANGQPFDCVLTPMNELVCTSTWTHESAYGNLWYSETSCPFEVTAVLWPDVAGTASDPYQVHAYWHVKAVAKYAFDPADQCLGAEAACIAYR